MNTYREKFLEAEKQANQLVDQLAKLKEETVHYRDAGESLAKSQERVSDLISGIEDVLEEQRELIGALKEIGTEEIISAIQALKEIGTEEILNAINSQSKRLQIFLYISLGLAVVVGILVVVLK
jgi:DNA repair exonuclease SbcCD ATPase subunit